MNGNLVVTDVELQKKMSEREAYLAGQEDRNKLHYYLKSKYPFLFSKPYKPFQLRIHKQILEENKDINPKVLKQYMAKFVRNYHYLEAVVEAGAGGSRYSLSGEVAGVIKAEDVQFAIMALSRHKKLAINDKEKSLKYKRLFHEQKNKNV